MHSLIEQLSMLVELIFSVVNPEGQAKQLLNTMELSLKKPLGHGWQVSLAADNISYPLEQ